jgi:hypothetical protein
MITLTVLLLALCLASLAAAQAPTTMMYQGRLTNASGAPITTATSVVFSIYSAATGGSAAWTETKSITPDAQGFFTTELGSTTALGPTLFTGPKLYLGIKVGSDAEMTPRQILGSVPYAQRDGGAMGGMHPIAFAIVNTDGSLRASSGNISCVWNASSQWYEIAITGVTFDLWHHFAMVQQIGASRNFYATTDGGGGGKLLVRVHDNTGATVQFYFEVMIFDLPGLAKSEPAMLPAGMTQSEAAAQTR